MSNKLKPLVTKWYRRLDSNEEFEVIAVDESDGIVDVQTFDGEVMEMTLKTWRSLDLAHISVPEWHESYGNDESNRDTTSLNMIWDKWQKGSGMMH